MILQIQANLPHNRNHGMIIAWYYQDNMIILGFNHHILSTYFTN